jgi:hypothetical protein
MARLPWTCEGANQVDDVEILADHQAPKKLAKRPLLDYHDSHGA